MNYAVIKKNDIANGPGVRISLFVSGCRHHCKGCFNSEAWDFNFGSPFTDDTIESILKSSGPSFVSGLSFLGGEPFEPENRQGLIKLAEKFREKYPEKNIWCYTGFLFEHLYTGTVKEPESAKKLLSVLDVLVDGKFEENLKNASLLFRGSENQRIIDVQKSLVSGNVVLLDGKWERTMGSTDIYDN